MQGMRASTMTQTFLRCPLTVEHGTIELPHHCKTQSTHQAMRGHLWSPQSSAGTAGGLRMPPQSPASCPSLQASRGAAAS